MIIVMKVLIIVIIFLKVIILYFIYWSQVLGLGSLLLPGRLQLEIYSIWLFLFREHIKGWSLSNVLDFWEVRWRNDFWILLLSHFFFSILVIIFKLNLPLFLRRSNVTGLRNIRNRYHVLLNHSLWLRVFFIRGGSLFLSLSFEHAEIYLLVRFKLKTKFWYFLLLRAVFLQIIKWTDLTKAWIRTKFVLFFWNILRWCL